MSGAGFDGQGQRTPRVAAACPRRELALAHGDCCRRAWPVHAPATCSGPTTPAGSQRTTARVTRWRSSTPTATPPPIATWCSSAAQTGCRRCRRAAARSPQAASRWSTRMDRPRRCRTTPATRRGSWNVEESLDIDAVSSLCPLCKIVVVEANSDDYYGSPDLETGVSTAAGLSGVNQISLSWGSRRRSRPRLRTRRPTTRSPPPRSLPPQVMTRIQARTSTTPQRCPTSPPWAEPRLQPTAASRAASTNRPGQSKRAPTDQPAVRSPAATQVSPSPRIRPAPSQTAPQGARTTTSRPTPTPTPAWRSTTRSPGARAAAPRATGASSAAPAWPRHSQLRSKLSPESLTRLQPGPIRTPRCSTTSSPVPTGRVYRAST